MKKVVQYLCKVIRSNTGVSSLSFILVTVGLVAILMLLVICACMLIEVISTSTISSSLEGYAAMVGAIAGLITSIGLPKAINNYGEKKYKSKVEDIE